jgi:hypothetical protein
MQKPSPFRTHTLMQGEGGGVVGDIPDSGLALNYGGCPSILQTRKTDRQPIQNKNLNVL